MIFFLIVSVNNNSNAIIVPVVLRQIAHFPNELCSHTVLLGLYIYAHYLYSHLMLA